MQAMHADFDDVCQGRLQHVCIEGPHGRLIHVFNIYGFDVGQPSAQQHNARLHEALFSTAAQLGQVMWLACGDWNMQPGDVWH
eukprot:11179090-Lingulodinium_polyedra.AAC.1